MESLRFPQGRAGYIGWKDFLAAYARFLEGALVKNTNLNIILFPHIFKDVLSIGEFMTYLDDRLCRDRIIVAPFACGWQACNHIFALYKKCDLVMGMRFHTNVCSIAMKVPAIPLISYPKLHDLYEELDLLERAVYANREDFAQQLDRVVTEITNGTEAVKTKNKQVLATLNAQSTTFFEKISELVSSVSST